MILTNRIIKVASCFAAIIMLLVASLYVPAYAASWTTVVPADNISETHMEGNVRVVTFKFPTTPLGIYNYSGTSGTFTNYIKLPIDHTYEPPVFFGMYPLGKYVEGGNPLSSSLSGGIAVDASDFKSGAILDFYSNFRVKMNIGYNSIPDSQVTEAYQISVTWSFFEYASNGDFIGYKDTSSTFKNFVLQDVGDYYTVEQDLPVYCPLSLHSADVAYFIPIVDVALVRMTDTDAIELYDVAFRFDEFTMTTRTDMLVDQSLTLDAIEGELGDLNDKADTIINGTLDQQQNASDMLGQAQDSSEAAQDAMDYEDALIEDFFDENGNNLGIEMSKITLFDLFNSDGWGRLMELFEPIMVWPTTSVLMLMVVAVANLSVILFGR